MGKYCQSNIRWGINIETVPETQNIQEEKKKNPTTKKEKDLNKKMAHIWTTDTWKIQDC